MQLVSPTSCVLEAAAAEEQEGMGCQVFFPYNVMNNMPAAEVKLILLSEWGSGVIALEWGQGYPSSGHVPSAQH